MMAQFAGFFFAMSWRALLARLDAPRDAEVLAVGHVDHVPARQRDLRGEARPLGADRFLGHLDQHFLALGEHLLDRLHGRPLARRPAAATSAIPATAVTIATAAVPVTASFFTAAAVAFIATARRIVVDVDAAFHLEFVGIGHEVARVEEAGFFVADVHERGLDAGQNGVHAPEVHVAHEPARLRALDHELDELSFFNDGGADFE
jgi:hypothetical protein